MGLDTCACVSVRGVRGKKDAAPTNFAREHAERGRGDGSPGFENKLEVGDEGPEMNIKEGLAVDSTTMMSGEVGVLVREEVTDGVMDIL